MVLEAAQATVTANVPFVMVRADAREHIVIRVLVLVAVEPAWELWARSAIIATTENAALVAEQGNASIAAAKESRVISLYTTTLIDKTIQLVCAYPMREMRSSSFSSSNLMLRPLIATTLSRASRLRVRMALLVVMLLRLAISSRLNLILSVHPSSSMP